MYKLALATVALISTFNLALTSPCANPELQADFDPSSYVGRWYEIQRKADFYFEKDGVCDTADYSLN